MKSTRFNFWRTLSILCAVFILSFSFMSCQQAEDDENSSSGSEPVVLAASDGIIGEWISSYGEKYLITQTDYDNYSHYDSSYNYDASTWYLYYSTTDLYKIELTSTTGYIYGKFDDADHIGYGATLGQWYALYYDNLTSSSVSLYQPYKADGKAGCDSLEEAVEEFTLANGYYNLSSPSECTK